VFLKILKLNIFNGFAPASDDLRDALRSIFTFLRFFGLLQSNDGSMHKGDQIQTQESAQKLKATSCLLSFFLFLRGVHWPKGLGKGIANGNGC